MWRSAPLVALVVLACEEPPPPRPIPAPPPEPALEPAPAPPPARPGPACTYHGWCWQSPLPQGNDLFGVQAFADEVVAVGERGTIVRRREGTWALEDTPIGRERLRDVWGASPEALVAVGDRGVVLRYADGAWARVEVGTDADLHAIDGAEGVAYAVGAAGVVARWDGEAWALEAIATELPLVDVRVSPAGVHALAVDPRAARAVLFARGEAGWAELEAFDADLGALLVSPEGAIVVAGADARHRDERGTWSTEALDLERPVSALFHARDAAFAAGYEGALARWDGERWGAIPGGVESDLHALSGTSASDVWAVGADGVILHYDGTLWTREGGGSTAHLKGVWGSAPDRAWAVGDHATLRWDGLVWVPDGPSEHDLRSVFGIGDTFLAAGDDGALWRYAAGAWTGEHRAEGEELDGVWGADAEHLLVVGKDVWLEREAGAWTEHTDRPDAAGVWGFSREDVWVAGREGLHHWDGVAWSAVPSTSAWVMFAVWGAAPDDVWAAGAGGRLLHYDGARWSEVEGPTRQNLLGLWGTRPDDVWAVGQHGTILHWDGARWRWRDSGTDELLHAVWGTGPRDVFVVGHGGTVLHYEGP